MQKHMALSIEECVEYTHMKDKITAIIPTRNAGIEFLLWSTFSLLLRSNPEGPLEHFCVCINSPDERQQPDLSLENSKQTFLEELRNLDWYHANAPEKRKSMPVTVIRVWSRVGYAETFEMAINWVHTDSYLLMHDDVMILNSKWCDEVDDKFFKDKQVAIAYVPPFFGSPCDSAVHRGMYLIRLPQLETTFILCKKKDFMKVGALWRGYHIPSDDNVLQFDLNEIGNLEEFETFWKSQDLYPKEIPQTELFNFVRQEIGAWVYYKLLTNGYKFSPLEENNILHFKGMSRNDNWQARKEKIVENKKEIIELEKLIGRHPEYSKLYKKYLPTKVRNVLDE